MTFQLSDATRAVLDELERMRRARHVEHSFCYTAMTQNEWVDSRIIGGPDSELIPPGRGRCSIRGMRP